MGVLGTSYASVGVGVPQRPGAHLFPSVEEAT